MAGHAIGFEFKLMAQPTLGLDAADGQFDERAGRERLAVGDVKRFAFRVGLGGAGEQRHKDNRYQYNIF